MIINNVSIIGLCNDSSLPAFKNSKIKTLNFVLNDLNDLDCIYEITINCLIIKQKKFKVYNSFINSVSILLELKFFYKSKYDSIAHIENKKFTSIEVFNDFFDIDNVSVLDLFFDLSSPLQFSALLIFYKNEPLNTVSSKNEQVKIVKSSRIFDSRFDFI